MRRLHIQLAITFVAGALALGHLFFPMFRVDTITVALVALAAIPWLGSLFSSLEIPGIGKVTYSELELLKDADADVRELITSDDEVAEKIKEGQKVVDELFKLGYSAGGGRGNVENVQIVRDPAGQIVRVEYDETA